MKNISKLLVFVFVLTLSSAGFAQKFAHIESQKLLNDLPETKAANETLEKEAKKMEEQIQVLSAEYQNKYTTWMENQQLAEGAEEKWSDAIKQDKEAEIMQLQERIQKFQQTAQQDLQKKRAELYEPILEKIDQAIKKVAKANNYIIVFDKNAVLYIDEAQCKNITDDVKKELGL